MIKSNLPKSETLSESRRKFIEKAGLTAVWGVCATCGITTLNSCSPEEEDINPTNTNNPDSDSGIIVSGSTIVIDLTVKTNLVTSGGWLLIRNANTLVANISGSYVALTSVCTHNGVTDNWGFSNNNFRCNQHGSVFNSSGDVLEGPANSPLAKFATSVLGNKLTITK